MDQSNFTFAAEYLKIMKDQQLISMIAEIGNEKKQQTSAMANDALHRMVISGSSPDVITEGYPQALEIIEKMILIEAAGRWQKLLRAVQEEM